MIRPLITSLALATALFVPGCANLQPPLPEAKPAIPADWPLPAETPQTVGDATATADIGWRDFFADPRLDQLVALALENNRDLRVAVLKVERARAQYRIQRADRLPSLGAEASMTRSGGDSLAVSESYTASAGIVGFELDLFGRVHNLSQVALEQFLATEEAHRSAQLALIAEVANTWLTLAADQESLAIAQATLDNHMASFRLTEQRHAQGAVSGLDVSQARTVVETARSDVARYKAQVLQGRNTLTLLVGAPVDESLLPDAFTPQVSGLANLPAGLPSQVLLRRPDVLAAEHGLRAANANIGAARAAFFPSITLTGSIGSSSAELSGLFDGGNGVWSFVPRINIPIFQGGRLTAALGVARADRDIALAEYEKAIQSAFREVADALALSGTLAARRSAQEALLAAASQAHTFSRARYEAGQDSYLVLLDAQRTLYSARQSLVAAQLAEQANRVTLYKVLGGGWREGGK